MPLLVLAGACHSDAAAPAEQRLGQYQKSGDGRNCCQPEPPVGLVFCLVHDSTLALGPAGILPRNFLTAAVVGCDTVVTPQMSPAARIFEFTPRDRGFSAVAERLTNGRDEGMFFWTYSVETGLRTVRGQGSNARESTVTGRTGDLEGFEITRIRLEVKEMAFTVEATADGFSHEFSTVFLWEIFGQPIR